MNITIVRNDQGEVVAMTDDQAIEIVDMLGYGIEDGKDGVEVYLDEELQSVGIEGVYDILDGWNYDLEYVQTKEKENNQ